jgi:hypothetical protein
VSKGYLCAFVALFLVLFAIAVFVNDGFVRPYLGDVLVVWFVYCFVRTFVANEFYPLPLYVFIFAALVEVGQYFNLVPLLGLESNVIARVVIGTHYDFADIVCYFVGCAGLFLYEWHRRERRC